MCTNVLGEPLMWRARCSCLPSYSTQHVSRQQFSHVQSSKHLNSCVFYPVFSWANGGVSIWGDGKLSMYPWQRKSWAGIAASDPIVQSYKGCQPQNMAGVSPKGCRRPQQKYRKSSSQTHSWYGEESCLFWRGSALLWVVQPLIIEVHKVF
jgi:hypothetical protein